MTQDGAQIDEEYVEKIFDKIENIFDSLDDVIENELDDDSDQSLGRLLDEIFIKLFKKLTLNEPANSELIKAIYRARLNEERFETACDNLQKLSAVGWNEYEDFEGEPFTKLKYGYKKLVDYLSSQLPQASIRLNEVVEKIDYSIQGGAQITVLNTMENKRKIYMADYVVNTMSLGYLKECHYDLFEPKLPLLKVKAIENLGIGCVNKLFVVFESDMLKKKVEGLQILWRDDLDFVLDANAKWKLQVYEK